MKEMTIRQMFYSIKKYGFICDGEKYEIGDISEKTGLEKVGEGEWRKPKEETEKLPDGVYPNETVEEIKENLSKVEKLQSIDISKNENIDNKEKIESFFDKVGTIKNNNDNNSVDFPKTTAGKIHYHKGFPIGKIIYSIPELFKTSQFVYSEPEKRMENHKFHSNIEEYKNYINKVQLDGKDYFIRFTARKEKVVRKLKKEKRNEEVHSIAISDIEIYEKIKAGQTYQTVQTTAESSESKPFIDKRLAQLTEKINSTQTNDNSPTLSELFNLIKLGKKIA